MTSQNSWSECSVRGTGARGRGEANLIYTLDILRLHLRALALQAHQISGGDHVDGIAEGSFHGDSAEQLLRIIAHFNILFFTANCQNLLDFWLGVWLCGNDEQAVQKIDGKAVGALVVGAPDAGDASIGGED